MLLLTNGKVYMEGTLRDLEILIKDDKIEKIDKKIDEPDARVIPCNNLIIVPGAIDIHVHFRDFNEKQKEDWETGSKAAAKGGNTAVFDMPNNNPPITTKSHLNKKATLAKKSIINYGFYYGLAEENLDHLKEVADKVCAFKLHMSKTTGTLTISDPKLQDKAFRKVSETQKPIVIHAEDQTSLDLAARLTASRTDFLAQADSRPKSAEISAVRDALKLAEKYSTITHFTHISTKEAAQCINHAKFKGLDVTYDTTPTYLYLTRENLEKMGALCKINPPVRTEEDRQYLWSYLKQGTIDIISTDHAPHTIEEKSKEFKSAPSGVPGVQFRLPLILDAVNKNKLTLDTFINTCCTNPAKRFNLKGRGEIKEGNYADLTIIDMDTRKTIKKEDIISKCGWSPYEGMNLKGWPVMTIVNGKVVYRFGEIYIGEGKNLFTGE